MERYSIEKYNITAGNSVTEGTTLMLVNHTIFDFILIDRSINIDV